MASMLQKEIKQTQPFRSAGHEAAVALLRTTDMVRRHVSGVLEPFEITLPQYNVLRILRGAEPDGLCINEIADRLIERNPGITRMIDRLERSKWVRRERQTEDRRMILCFLTPEGRKLVNRLDEPVQAADDEIVSDLSTTDTRRLIRILETIREQLAT